MASIFIGDIAFRLFKYAKHINGVPEVPNVKPLTGLDVTVCDISPSMMEVGKSRAEELGFSSSMLIILTFISSFFCKFSG